MIFKYNDGGRVAAGFKGTTGDCVVRAVAIITGTDYRTIYNELHKYQGSTPRDGVAKKTTRQYLLSKGFKWYPTMGVGTGCRVHLVAHELPAGKLIVSVSRHVSAVINGVILDTYDCSRGGTRCVYGYYTYP